MTKCMTKQIPYRIRYASADDDQALLNLMWQLAEFEAYAHAFKVDAVELRRRGLAVTGEQNRQFTAIVAQALDWRLLAYAVLCQQDFTYDLRPTLLLKELFVSEAERGQGIASKLMAFVLQHARDVGAGRLKWDVLPDNLAAQAFYRRLGAEAVSDWQAWRLDLPG